ncbi:hypothetical protein [Alteromonas facilis]|uniref:hypothetical protein n=1 Tax=Alteromonas facilis TaxID=2048004 RepID=UPI000C28642F|nr:hypothetical protein [Alteromonas facilis]
MATNQIDARQVIEIGCIYYSKEDNQFFIGAYGGLGNFDVQEVGVSLDNQLKEMLEKRAITIAEKSLTAFCVGVLGEPDDNFVGYWATFSKVGFSDRKL